MCYQGEANSIRLCRKCSVNSRMLSIDCRYMKGNSHTIHLCRVDSLPRRMPNSVQIYHTFCFGSVRMRHSRSVRVQMLTRLYFYQQCWIIFNFFFGVGEWGGGGGVVGTSAEIFNDKSEKKCSMGTDSPKIVLLPINISYTPKIWNKKLIFSKVWK